MHFLIIFFFPVNRAEDFLVNEVDMDGNIVHLTSTDPPNTKTVVELSYIELTDWNTDEIVNRNSKLSILKLQCSTRKLKRL